MGKRRITAGVVSAIAVTSLLAACGDTEDPDDDAADTTEPTVDDTSDATDATGGDDGDGEDGAATSLEFTAEDIDFAEEEASAAAGDLDVTLTNEGAIEHSWLVEDHEDDLRLYVMANGDTDEGTIALESGTYTYYCDIPGHRDAGMEGTLTVE